MFARQARRVRKGSELVGSAPANAAAAAGYDYRLSREQISAIDRSIGHVLRPSVLHSRAAHALARYDQLHDAGRAVANLHAHDVAQALLVR
jgi:hypothetical protein